MISDDLRVNTLIRLCYQYGRYASSSPSIRSYIIKHNLKVCVFDGDLYYVTSKTTHPYPCETVKLKEEFALLILEQLTAEDLELVRLQLRAVRAERRADYKRLYRGIDSLERSYDHIPPVSLDNYVYDHSKYEETGIVRFLVKGDVERWIEAVVSAADTFTTRNLSDENDL